MLINLKSKIINHKFSDGFSVLEVVIALTVITIGLVGVLALVNQNIQAQQINRNMLIASQLAQEGLELVRNKRDTNWLVSGNDWKLGAGAGSPSDIVQSANSNKYIIDYYGNITTSGVNDINSDAANLKIDANGFYNHASGDSTIFYRLITVADNGDWIEVNSQVRWKERGGTKDYTASTILYNWR